MSSGIEENVWKILRAQETSISQLLLRGNRDLDEVRLVYQGIIDGTSVSKTDPRFKCVRQFELVVPENFEHETCLRVLWATIGGSVENFPTPLRDDNNFRLATHHLEPGDRFNVKVYRIVSETNAPDCLEFMRGQKAECVGAQGLSILCTQSTHHLPRGAVIGSLDSPDALYRSVPGSELMVPAVLRSSEHTLELRLCRFHSPWQRGSHFVCFCPKRS